MVANHVEPCRHLIRDVRRDPVGTRAVCGPCGLIASVGHRWLTIYRVGAPETPVGRIPWEPLPETDFSRARYSA